MCKNLHSYFGFSFNNSGGVFADTSCMGSGVQTVMIIDDDVDLGLLLISTLETRKIYTMAVHTLPEAEEYLSYLKPTVIFLDNSFPEGLGVNFIRNIKSADAEIKIVMMTADPAVWIEQKAIDEGANYFLRKPFNIQTLDNVLDQLNFKKEEQ